MEAVTGSDRATLRALEPRATVALCDGQMLRIRLLQQLYALSDQETEEAL